MMAMKRMTASSLTAILFFLLLLIVGTAIYSNYGMSWDETTQLDLGIQNYRYIFKADPSLLSMRDRWYSPAFEIFLVVFQSNGNDRQVYLSRHLLTFLTFFSGCIAFYFLAKRFIRSSWLALIGTICLVLSPRIFAHAFYNSKDIPFLVMYVFSLYTMISFLDRPTIWRGIGHAVASALLIAVRVPGVIIPFLTLLGLVCEVVCRRLSLKSALVWGAMYLLLVSGGSILFWPALWTDPIHGFVEAFRMMSQFPHETSMLYLEQHISSLFVPWHYGIVWLAITTPILYLAGFVLGLIILIRRLKGLIQIPALVERRDELLVLLAFAGPLATVIIFKSVIYDGWRQLFFIYPAFILVMLKGMQVVWMWLKQKFSHRLAFASAVIGLAVGILPVMGWMVTNHPYQNVYFNRLAGQEMTTVQQRFMLDYWGLAYREGIEAVLETDRAQQINIFMETIIGQRTIAILPPQEAARVHVVNDLKDADYFIGNYYLTSEPYPFKDEIYHVTVGNAKILSVFRLSDEEKK